MNGDTMKSGVIETDREKLELRHPHRRKMAKSLHVLNGGGDLEVNMVRQVNLAAAYHDHISCTKSADLCNKISDAKESRANLPFETDHIYANCSEARLAKIYNMVAVTPSKDERRQLQDMCLLHLKLIKHLKEQNAKKEKQIRTLRQENKVLKIQKRMETRARQKKNHQKQSLHSCIQLDNVSDVEPPISPVMSALRVSRSVMARSSTITPAARLVTRYFGRRSKTIPLRALKRRYWGPPKDFTFNKCVIKSSSSAASVSSVSETHDDDDDKTPNYKEDDDDDDDDSSDSITGRLSSNGSCFSPSIQIRRKPYIFQPCIEFMTTDREYHVLSNPSVQDDLNNTTTIEVPSWRLKPVQSFYQMEGTEDLDDSVFSHRHQKFETAEKRRKRWDLQRIRDQRGAQILQLEESQKSAEHPVYRKKIIEVDPNQIEEIEVTDMLPVVAFGHPIPLAGIKPFSQSEVLPDFFDQVNDLEDEDD